MKKIFGLKKYYYSNQYNKIMYYCINTLSCIQYFYVISFRSEKILYVTWEFFPIWFELSKNLFLKTIRKYQTFDWTLFSKNTWDWVMFIFILELLLKISEREISSLTSKRFLPGIFRCQIFSSFKKFRILCKAQIILK